GIAEVEHIVGLDEAAGAAAAHKPRAILTPFDRGAQFAQRLAGAKHVLTLEEAGHARLADGAGAQHQRAVRDRLVARRTGPALQGSGGVGAERLQGGSPSDWGV